jgi:hypothetical protein
MQGSEKDDVLYEALAHFVDGGVVNDYMFEATSGGVNNLVFYVIKKEVREGGGGGKALTGVLRVYNNGNDDPKVALTQNLTLTLTLNPHSNPNPKPLPLSPKP